MISPNDILVTKTDLTLFSTVLVVANVVGSQLMGTRMLDEAWMNLAVATLAGVALHGLLTNKLSAMVNDRLQTEVKGVSQSVYDLVKFGTVFVSQRVITSYLAGVQVQFDRTWALTSGMTIAGYAVFNMIQHMVPQIGGNQQPLVNDLIKVSMGALLANYVVDGTINQYHLMALAATLSGFVAFHFGTKRLVVPAEKFSQVGGYSTKQ
jgi:hypothetical protein